MEREGTVNAELSFLEKTTEAALNSHHFNTTLRTRSVVPVLR